MADYRPITDADRAAFRRGRYYAFAPGDGPAAYETDDEPIMGTHREFFDGAASPERPVWLPDRF